MQALSGRSRLFLATTGARRLLNHASLHPLCIGKAVDECFAEKPNPVIPMPDMSGMVVVRKSKYGRVTLGRARSDQFRAYFPVDAQSNDAAKAWACRDSGMPRACIQRSRWAAANLLP